MAIKAILFAALFAVAYAGAPLAVQAPVLVGAAAPANYEFGYAVKDPNTGDVKSQEEIRKGDVVQGKYSLIDSDGTRRIVSYTAGPYTGFNAVVAKEPLGVAIAPAPIPAIRTAIPALPAIAPAALAAPAAFGVSTGLAGLGGSVLAGPGLGLGYAGNGLGLGYAGNGLGLGYAGHGLGYSAGPVLAGHGFAAPALAGHGLAGHGIAGPVGYAGSNLGLGLGHGLY